MSSFWLAQLIGACAVVFSIFVYQLDRRSFMLRLSSVASLLYALQFVLLHAYTGAAMNLIAAVRNYMFDKRLPKQDEVWILYVFLALGAIATALTWKGAISLLPLGGNWLNALATWQIAPKRMRRFALFAPPLWILYALRVHSYPTLIIEVFILCSNIVGQYRFDLKYREYRGYKDEMS